MLPWGFFTGKKMPRKGAFSTGNWWFGFKVCCWNGCSYVSKRVKVVPIWDCKNGMIRLPALTGPVMGRMSATKSYLEHHHFESHTRNSNCGSLFCPFQEQNRYRPVSMENLLTLIVISLQTQMKSKWKDCKNTLLVLASPCVMIEIPMKSLDFLEKLLKGLFFGVFCMLTCPGKSLWHWLAWEAMLRSLQERGRAMGVNLWARQGGWRILWEFPKFGNHHFQVRKC